MKRYIVSYLRHGTGPSREFLDYEHSKMLRSRAVGDVDDVKGFGGVRPSFITLPQSTINVHEYEPLTLRCVVDGHPKPTGRSLAF